MKTMRSDYATGSGRKTTALTTANMAMFAPRQTAREKIAVAENPRSFQSRFTAVHISRITYLLCRMLKCHRLLRFLPTMHDTRNIKSKYRVHHRKSGAFG